MTFWGIFVLSLLCTCDAFIYEDSISEMLSQCNIYQHEVNGANRTKHLCEKSVDDDYSYFITPLESRHDGRKFWCFLFFKDEFFKLKFKFWFSHSNYSVNAFGVKFSKPVSDKWESWVKFKVSSMVVLPSAGAQLPQIFGLELNGHDKCPFCGHRLQSVGLISQGREAVPSRWPWHVALFYQEGFDLAYKCGGSIIRDNAVLTAAHCVTQGNVTLSEKIMRVGIEQGKFLSETSQQLNVFKLNVHENYQHESLENDIALLQLQSKITFSTKVQAICLPQLGLVNEGIGTVVGFGSTGSSIDHSKVLREVEISIVSNEVCHDSDPYYFGQRLFDGNFCAGEIGLQKGVCKGDSGGGLYVEKDNLWFLKGITSNTKQNFKATNPTCNDASYAIFTDVNKYLEWIDDKIKFVPDVGSNFSKPLSQTVVLPNV